MDLFESKSLSESSSPSTSDVSNEQNQLVHNDRNTSENSNSSNDYINKLKFSNTRNLVAITGNKITGDQITNIIQSTNKEPRTSLKFGLPFSQENVIGRDNEVAQLYKLLKSSDHKPVAITGMGGLGKTTLAIHCAYVWSSGEQYENIQNIAFLNAENDDSFKQSIKEFAKELNIQVKDREIRGIMREIFNNFTKKGLLMIYDNVDAYSVVKDYLPENIPNVYILATSQLTELKAFFNCYELKVLNDVDSKTLVMSVFSEGSFSNINEEDLEELLRVFGGLPLGLLQAAAYIKDIIENEDDEYTIKDYMKKYNTYLDEPFPDDFKINYKYTVYIALTINIDKIKEESTKQILWCMGYLDPRNIESKLFLQHFGKKQVEKAVRGLVKYSIVKKKNVKMYAEKLTIHRLLQEVCRKIVEHDKIQHIKLAIKLTVKSYNLLDHYSFIFPHIEDDLLFLVFTEGFRQALDSGEFLDNLKHQLCLIELDKSILDHWDAWHFASYCNYYFIIEVFRQRGIIFDNKEHGWTPLHAAALKESQWNIRNAISRLPEEVKMNAQTSTGLTSLHIAALGHRYHKRESILFDSVDINAQTSTGLTSLHISVALQNFDNICELVHLGCDVNIRDHQGNTPLHWAAINMNIKSGSHKAVAEMLIHYGADINIRNNNNQTALEIYGQVTDDVTIGDTVVKCSQTVIIVKPEAPSGEQLENFLISLDILINTTDGEQLVINKLNRCHWWNKRQEKLVPELIKLLFNARIALDIVTSYILNEDISLEKVIQILKQNDQHTELDMFVNCTESRFKNIYRVICMAIDIVEKKYSDAFKLLSYEIYKESFDYTLINRKNIIANAKMLVQYSLVEEYNYYINNLIRQIIHVYSLKRKTAYSILEYILQSERYYAQLYLLSLNFMHIKDIQQFSEKEYRQSGTLKLFITKLKTFGCNIKSTKNWSALHYVCTDTSLVRRPLVRRLIDLKFYFDMSVNGITPIHLACFREVKYIVDQSAILLITAGVNVNVKTAEGITPLHLAYTTGHGSMGLLLISAGADINAKDCNGNTPSHYAARYGFVDILRELQKRGADQGVNCKGETPEDLLQRDILSPHSKDGNHALFTS